MEPPTISETAWLKLNFREPPEARGFRSTGLCVLWINHLVPFLAGCNMGQLGQMSRKSPCFTCRLARVPDLRPNNLPIDCQCPTPKVYADSCTVVEIKLFTSEPRKDL